MATQTEVSRNPRPHSSGKSASFSTTSRLRRHLALAAEVARRLGIVPTWPNVQTIRLAIESEAAYSEISPNQAAELIVLAARDFIVLPAYDTPTEWRRRLILRLNLVDRFWFEDARWRDKPVYADFREKLSKTPC